MVNMENFNVTDGIRNMGDMRPQTQSNARRKTPTNFKPLNPYNQRSSVGQSNSYFANRPQGRQYGQSVPGTR